jgi:hypothetical protein
MMLLHHLSRNLKSSFGLTVTPVPSDATQDEGS